MTKSEFLAQENVPEFIKAIVSSLPGDADVEIESFKLGKPPKKESCSCDRVHEDGVDISAYVEGIGDRVVSLIELTDCNRMTDGISFSHNVIGAIAAEALRQAGLAHKNRQVDFEKRFLQGEATITGTPGGYFSTTYPFVLVPIPAGTEHTQTNTPHYDVTLCVTAADDIGKVNLEVYDKASNGFKVRNLGSAKSVSFTWTIINTNIQ